MKNLARLLTLILLLSPFKLAFAQSGCDRVWIGGCKSNPMDKVSEVMKRLWNEDLAMKTWRGNNRLPFKIDSIAINSKTIQIRYKYTRKAHHWYLQDNKQILSLPGVVAVTYGMSSENDARTGIPMIGASLVGYTTSNDDMKLIRSTTEVYEDYLHGGLPAKFFRLALHTVFTGSNFTIKGSGRNIIKNNGGLPLIRYGEWGQDPMDDFYVVVGEHTDGKSIAVKLTRDGVVINQQILDGTSSFFYEGVSSFNDGYFTTYSPGEGIDDFKVVRDRVYTDLYNHDLEYILDGAMLPGTDDSVWYGTNHNGEGYFGRSLEGYDTSKGGCQEGIGGDCVSTEGDFWDGTSTIPLHPIFDVDLKTFDPRWPDFTKILVTASSLSSFNWTLDFHWENFTWWDFPEEKKVPRVSSSIKYSDLGVPSSAWYTSFQSHFSFNTNYVYTVGSYETRGNENSYLLIKSDGFGKVVWVYNAPQVAGKKIKSLAVDEQDNILLVGQTIELSGNIKNQHDAYAVKFSSDGKLVKEMSWGLPEGNEGYTDVIYDQKFKSFFVTGHRPELDRYDEPIKGTSLLLFQRLSASDLKSELGDVEDGH